MSDVFGALSQVLPAAATLATAYACPTGKRATVQAILCNQGAATTARLAHSPEAAPIAATHYLFYDLALAAGGSIVTEKFTLKAGDVLRVYSTSGSVGFNINGIEEDA